MEEVAASWELGTEGTELASTLAEVPYTTGECLGVEVAEVLSPKSMGLVEEGDGTPTSFLGCTCPVFVHQMVRVGVGILQVGNLITDGLLALGVVMEVAHSIEVVIAALILALTLAICLSIILDFPV